MYARAVDDGRRALRPGIALSACLTTTARAARCCMVMPCAGGFDACAFNSTQIGDSVSIKTAIAFQGRVPPVLPVLAALTAWATEAPE